MLDGLPCPPPEDLPNPGIKSASPMPPALAHRFFTTRGAGGGDTQIHFECIESELAEPLERQPGLDSGRGNGVCWRGWEWMGSSWA